MWASCFMPAKIYLKEVRIMRLILIILGLIVVFGVVVGCCSKKDDSISIKVGTQEYKCERK